MQPRKMRVYLPSNSIWDSWQNLNFLNSPGLVKHQISGFLWIKNGPNITDQKNNAKIMQVRRHLCWFNCFDEQKDHNNYLSPPWLNKTCGSYTGVQVLSTHQGIVSDLFQDSHQTDNSHSLDPAGLPSGRYCWAVLHPHTGSSWQKPGLSSGHGTDSCLLLQKEASSSAWSTFPLFTKVFSPIWK